MAYNLMEFPGVVATIHALSYGKDATDPYLAIDQNIATYTTYTVTGGTAHTSITWRFTFPQTVAHVTRVRVQGRRRTGVSQVGYGYIDIIYTDESSDRVQTLPEVNTESNVDYDNSGSWVNVKAIEVNFTSRGELYTLSRLAELTVEGNVYADSGIRVQAGGSVVGIGVHHPDTGLNDGLKVQTPAGTRNIALVATDDDFASPIRIFDGTAVKALAKVIE